jgi:transglutaminase-like putative cysteine protease
MRAILLGVAPWVALPLLAQAPVITPKGDPSVRADSIYQLAVNPADYPDQPFVYLLDDGVIVHQADGTGRATYRQVIQILTRDAASQWGEHSFSYVAKRETFTLNWARVLSLDGKVISDGPLHEQETTAPVAQEYPVYTDTKILRMTLGSVEPGTIVDLSYTTETLQPAMPGSFGNSWSVNTGRPTRRSRLIVDVPASLTPRIEQYNLSFPRQTDERNGRRVYEWATRDVPVVDPEPFAGWPNTVDMQISVGAPLRWNDVARWYAGLAKDRYAFGAGLDSVFRAVTVAGMSRDDSLHALYRWVAQEIRYVSLALGQGGYQPRPPEEVVSTRLGDCKDKATLLVTLLRHMGARAYPVLVSLNGQPDSLMPGPGQFDHVIVALEGTGGYRFLDPTAELAPFGELDSDLQGEFGLLVRPDGSGEHVRLPEAPPSANVESNRLVGQLGADGAFAGRFTERMSGSRQYRLRQSLTSVGSLSAEQRDRLARTLANTVFDGASGDSLVLFDGRDLDAEPKISVSVQAPRAATHSGSEYILTLPLPTYKVSPIIQELESHPTRRYPIDAARVFGPATADWVVELTVPAGWRAKLPAADTATSAFGSYAATYTQDGQTVRIERRLAGARGIEPPGRVGDLIAWLKRIAADDTEYLVFETAGP